MQTAESEVETMTVDTGQFRLLQTERASLLAANARLVEKNNKLLELLKFGQDAFRSAAGNLTAFDERVRRAMHGLTRN